MVGVAIGTQVQTRIVCANVFTGDAPAHLALPVVLEFWVALHAGRGQKLHLLGRFAIGNLNFWVIFTDFADQPVINALVVLNVVYRKILPFCTSRQLKP